MSPSKRSFNEYFFNTNNTMNKMEKFETNTTRKKYFRLALEQVISAMPLDQWFSNVLATLLPFRIWVPSFPPSKKEYLDDQ